MSPRPCALCNGTRRTVVRMLDAPDVWLCLDCGLAEVTSEQERGRHDRQSGAHRAEARQREAAAHEEFLVWLAERAQRGEPNA